MIIGGLQKFSLLDYPEHLSAVIFTKGCNFRCQYCYNPMLVWPSEVGKLKNTFSPVTGEEIKKGQPQNDEDALFDFLKSRVGKLDAVVITGGEPTIHYDLPNFIKKIKNLGFKVKLDTNGTNPEILERSISRGSIDYIAMDIKAPEQKYDLVTGTQPDLCNIKNSIKIIKESGLPYEFRTTVVPELLLLDDIEEIGRMIEGAEKWFLQTFKSDADLVNKDFTGYKAYTSKEMEKLRKKGEQYVKGCKIR